MKTFILKQTSKTFLFQINGTRFAVVQYGAAPVEIFGLLESVDDVDARFNINSLPVVPSAPEDKTKLIPALDFVSNDILLSDSVTQSVPKAVVIFSEEFSDDNEEELQTKLEELSALGIHFFFEDINDLNVNNSKKLRDDLCNLPPPPPITTTPPPSTTPRPTTTTG